tara:strand:+ start:211 stop:1080 length:870 start_codon:yes stop_codon:yes gene_type:complete
MKLAIGTAQFGLDYGISNRDGQINFAEAKSIIDALRINNIDTIDTAMNYGESELILGKIGIDGFKIVTKLPEIDHSIPDKLSWAKNMILKSLDSLNTHSISCILFHKSSDIFISNLKIYEYLLSLKESGIIDKIGVSIYDPSELDLILDKNIKIDIVQTPFSIFDRRLKSTGWLKKLSSMNVEVHARSIFLQGLILQKRADRNKYFNKWDKVFSLYEEWLNDTNQSKLSAAVNYVYSEKDISKVIVGVQSSTQLYEILGSLTTNNYKAPPKTLEVDDLSLINPTHWNLK